MGSLDDMKRDFQERLEELEAMAEMIATLEANLENYKH